MTEKQCNTCGVFKPLDAFAIRRSYLFPGMRYEWCKQCYREVRAEQRREAREAARDPEYIRGRATTAVHKAVRDGVLTRPARCESCGRGGRIEGHHADYSKPLEVEWLCKPCHRARPNGVL